METNTKPSQVLPEVESGKLYSLTSRESRNMGWAIFLDRVSTRMLDHIWWLGAEDAGTIFLAVEEHCLQDFNNVHYKLRQDYSKLRGFMFLTGDVRVWIPQDFWDRFEECVT